MLNPAAAVLAVVFAVSMHAADAIDTRCLKIDDLIETAELAQAREEHSRLAREAPSAPCVAALGQKLAAIRESSIERFNSGAALEKKGNVKTARFRYIDALKRDPSYTPAATGLVRLSTTVEQAEPFAEAERLSNLGLHADALDALKAAVKTTNEAVPPKLQYLSGGDFEWWRENVARNLDRWTRPAGEIVALAAVLLLLGSMIWARVRVPRAEVTELDDANVGMKVGKSMTALLRDRTEHLSANLLPRVGFVQGPSQAITLPATIVSAVPGSLSWLNAVPALFGTVHPRRVFTVSGTLHPMGEKGAGVTISLRESNRVLFTSTLWQVDFDPGMLPPKANDPSGYHDLAEPAAIWLLFRLSESDVSKGLTVLGTTYWRSYALFNAGLRREQEGDLESAEKLYVEALKRDSRNRGARLNLAVLLLAGDEHDRRRGTEQLVRAREESSKAPTAEADPIYYASSVRLAATLHNEKDSKRALEVATDLLNRIDEKLAEMDRLPKLGRKMGHFFALLRGVPFIMAARADRLSQKYLAYLQKQRHNAALEKTLTTMRPGLVIMVAGLRAVNGDGGAVEAMEHDPTIDRTVPSAGQQYNLACTYSIAAETTRDERYLDLSLSHFAFAQRLQPQHRTVVEADESLRYLREKREKRFGEVVEQYKPKPRAAAAPETPAPAPVPLPPSLVAPPMPAG